MSGAADKAILAGGCFWGMQDLFRKRPGVLSTRAGYSGGDVPNATYRNHGTHAEAIEIVFDPEQTTYRDLLEFFFQVHDPTTLNRQGNDIGTSYRSAIFYLDDEQRRIAEETIADVEASGRWPGKVRDRSRTDGNVPRSGVGASGLPRALSQRLYVSLRASRLGSAAANESRCRLGHAQKVTFKHDACKSDREAEVRRNRVTRIGLGTNRLTNTREHSRSRKRPSRPA
jgi:peptide-methionine (S)-S-oxide reductase